MSLVDDIFGCSLVFGKEAKKRCQANQLEKQKLRNENKANRRETNLQRQLQRLDAGAPSTGELIVQAKALSNASAPDFISRFFGNDSGNTVGEFLNGAGLGPLLPASATQGTAVQATDGGMLVPIVIAGAVTVGFVVVTATGAVLFFALR